jgi:branched-chain amino acid transport system ATP-binding protein
MVPALELRDIRGGYGETEVVRGVSLTIQPGQSYSLIGKNGMGKSTLLKLIMGLLTPKRGQVRFNGVDTTASGPRGLIAASVSYVPQDTPLFQDLTVGENLRLGALRLSRAEFEARKSHVFQMFPFLGERLTQRAGTLSGGEQKMLLLARALLPAPSLIILDEVSEGLQPSILTRAKEILGNEQSCRAVSLLVVEQNIDFAFFLAGRFGVLDGGLIVDEGSSTDSHARQRAEQYMTI